MTKHPMFSDPAQFPRMLGTMLAALSRWTESNVKLTEAELELASCHGQFAPLTLSETRALYLYLTSMDPVAPFAMPALQGSNTARYTDGPWSVVERGQRAYLMGRDAAGQWEIANVNLCMGVQSDANLAMIKHAPEMLLALQALLHAHSGNRPLPWDRANQAVRQATTIDAL